MRSRQSEPHPLHADGKRDGCLIPGFWDRLHTSHTVHLHRLPFVTFSDHLFSEPQLFHDHRSGSIRRLQHEQTLECFRVRHIWGRFQFSWLCFLFLFAFRSCRYITISYGIVNSNPVNPGRFSENTQHSACLSTRPQDIVVSPCQTTKSGKSLTGSLPVANILWGEGEQKNHNFQKIHWTRKEPAK